MAEELNEQKIKAVPKSTPEVGIDTSNSLMADLIDAAAVGTLDISSIDALSQSAQTREQTYQLLDSMAQDELISAVLSTYAGDILQTNDQGQTIWIESDDPQILDYTTWLLDSLNIRKQLYKWCYCLVTYGDVYVRLFRQSDVKEDPIFVESDKQRKLNEALDKRPLTEDTKLRIYSSDDHYIPYVQMVDNPGEMFDLQKFGKTHGYIKAPVSQMQQTSDELYNYLTRYKAKRNDVEIFDAMSFVHGCIESTTQRQPETVEIYLDSATDPENTDEMTSSYSVKRGQSILYNTFRIWRELTLLEMSAMLNRLTRSSLVRILNIDVGDMPKEQVRRFIDRLKEKIEQKTALNADKQTSQYTNPGPIENTIYVPTHGTQGTITAQSLGGDFDPKQLVDIEYFRDKLFGGLRVPKQFFGVTNDDSGFNGGTSLTIISSEYGKAIKSYQQIVSQMVTDILNLFLIDRGLDNYVYKFKVRMQEPVTQEELDKRANMDARINYVGNVMNQLNDIEDKSVKLKIYKSLVSTVVNDADVIAYLQEYIDTLETAKASKDSATPNDAMDTLFGATSDSSESAELPLEEPAAEEPSGDLNIPLESFQKIARDILNEESEEDDDSYLPSAADLGIDLTQKYERNED